MIFSASVTKRFALLRQNRLTVMTIRRSLGLFLVLSIFLTIKENLLTIPQLSDHFVSLIVCYYNGIGWSAVELLCFRTSSDTANQRV